MRALQQLLSTDDVLVVTDTETTGLHARVNRIIEIAAQRITKTSSDEWFTNLINPGVVIPGRISRITGITTSMVLSMPGADEVMPRYQDFLGDGIFVAHNIRFDHSFINAEFDRLELPQMENPGLCSLRLARRLLPGLRSKSLGNLAQFFKIPAEGRHRAAKDVEVTALVLERLAQIAIDEHHVSSINELIQLQGKTYAKVNPLSKHVREIKRKTLPQVPTSPGVYYMTDQKGKVLYVGKAKSLSQRVSSYFTAIEAHPPRLRQLISKVRQVVWDETSTELHALVLESRKIKEIDPPFNRAQKKYVPRPYLRMGRGENFPTLSVQVIVRDDNALYYGPLPSRSVAKTILEIAERYFRLRTCSSVEFAAKKRCVRADIGRCDAPCEGLQSLADYELIVEEVCAFLEGDIGPVCAKIEADMLRAAEKYAYEEAGNLRDWITLLDNRVIQTGVVAAPIKGPKTVYLTPWSSIEHGSFVLVVQGRVVAIEAVEHTSQLEKLIEHHLVGSEESLLPLDRVQTDARRILDHWIHTNKAKLLVLQQRTDESEGMFKSRIIDHYVSLQSPTIASA